jgi:ribonuclease R
MAAKKKGPPKDPAADREARRYQRPIPSRELILKCLHQVGEPMSFDELADYVELDEPDDLEALRRRLTAMVRDGQVLLNRREGYVPVDSEHLMRGRVIAHSDGFGFLAPDEGGGDLFLSPREMRRVLHGDRVVVQVTGVDRRGRREGSIAEILERANTRVVGHVSLDSSVMTLVPDNNRITQDLLIPPEHTGGAESGQIAVAEIVEQPTTRRQPIGRIVEVLGERMQVGMETDIAINSHGIPAEWPEAVEREAAELPDEVNAADKKERVDLRELPLVTIDSEDAQDFDDAVYCERRGNDWRLIVAIADVSAYIQPETALDAEAARRGTSVYFPGRVVPMLPEKLSNGLCSLNPDVDRLCMVCDMRIDDRGEIRRTRFREGVMRSHARLTYTEVAQMLLDRQPRARQHRSALVPHLENLYGLFEVLHRARKRRGAIDFDTTETEIQFGDDGRIADIEPVERNDAHRLIEECMIAANRATARYLRRQKLPALYRVHNGPEGDRVEDLRAFLAERGLKLGGGDEPQPDHFANVLRQAQDRPDAYLIQTVLLRSMQRAVYQPECSGHFGLALDEYAHFTSPIRRYPDLLVHRAIRHKLRGGKRRDYRYEHEDMVRFGDHCSMTERRADEATRDVEGVLKCQYMQDRVGEVFDGLITGVTSFGVFICLDATFAEGLVHVTSLPRDYYHFDPVGHCLTGERSGRIYRLGDPLQVRVTRVDVDDRKIDFEPVSEPVGTQPGSGGKGRSKKKAAAKKKGSATKKSAAAKKKMAGRKKVGARSVGRGGDGG